MQQKSKPRRTGKTENNKSKKKLTRLQNAKTPPAKKNEKQKTKKTKNKRKINAGEQAPKSGQIGNQTQSTHARTLFTKKPLQVSCSAVMWCRSNTSLQAFLPPQESYKKSVETLSSLFNSEITSWYELFASAVRNNAAQSLTIFLATGMK